MAVSGVGEVWRLAVAASFWRLFIRLTRRSRRTDGGGMLVGRTFGGEVGFGDMKLRVDGPDVDDGEVGFDLGFGFCFGDAGGAGAVLGPSVKSPQSSNESSSHVGCGRAGLTGCWAFFGAGFAGVVVTGCPSVNSPQSLKESSSHVGSGG